MNTVPKLISLGYALPPHRYTQRQVFEVLGYPRHFWPIFAGAQVDTRYFCLELEHIREKTWQEMCEAYLEWGKALSRESIRRCLDGRNTEDIGTAVFASCSGYQCPGILHHLAGELGLPADCFFTNVGGHGCEGAEPALKRAWDAVVATGRPALAVTTEICSATYFPEPAGVPDPENDYELLRGMAIFADASVAALVGHDDDPRHPYILDFVNVVDTSYIGELGYIWRDGRLRLRMSKQIPVIAPVLADRAVSRLLAQQHLSQRDIAHWVIHAAGNRILTNIGGALGLPEEKLTLSRETLRLFGNTSSTSVGITGKRLMESGAWRPGDYVVMVSLGPGMSSGATLLRFPPGKNLNKTPPQSPGFSHGELQQMPINRQGA